MEKFKGTKGKLELQYVSGVCIGIGTIGDYSQITANSVLPNTDEEYENERAEIEANMTLYATSPELLWAIQSMLNVFDKDIVPNTVQAISCENAKRVINKALGIPANSTDPLAQPRIMKATEGLNLEENEK